MPIALVTGPANSGKAEVVMDTLRGHLARGEDPLLVVPTRADAEHYMRELAGERAAMGVRVERFAGLIAEAVLRAGIAQPQIGTLGRERVLQSVAAGVTTGGEPTARPGARRGLSRALSELIAELQAKRISPARFSRALADWRAAEGADAGPHGLERVYRGYREALERLGRVDAEERAARALDALRERPALWGRTPVLFYGFDDLTPLQLDAVETLGAVVDAHVTVSLPYEPGRVAFAGRASTFQALRPLLGDRGEHRALQARGEHYAPQARRALGHLERSLFEPGAARVDAGAAVRLLEGGGERAELELVAHEISKLLRGGMAAEEVAVLVRGEGTSIELLEEAFAAAGLPFSAQRRRPFADACSGRALLGLLRCVPVAGDGAEGAGELEDLLAWLRAPGLLEVPALADRLELRARRAGAHGAAEARALWEERHWRLEAIDRLEEAAGRGPVALIERASRELYWLFCAPRRSAAAVLGAEELDEARALAAGRRALGELRELARAAPELAPASAGELAEALEAVSFLGGEAPGPGAIAVLDPLALRARRVRALFVCGLQEGAFPARSRPQPLLSEEERRGLAEATGLRLGEGPGGAHGDELAAERYLLYAAVSRPQELLVLSWHACDDEGRPTPRSLFVDDVCDLFAPELLRRRAFRPLGAVEGIDVDPVPPTEGGGELEAPGAPSPPLSPAPSRAEEPLREELVLAELAARPWSASALERRIACPVAWFVERLLRPEEFEPDPEPLARGSLAHEALRQTFEGLRAETGSARVTRATVARARELLDAALAAGEAERPLSTAPERRIAVMRRLQVDLERYLAQIAESESPLEPRELELGFGFEGEDDRGEAGSLPALELGGGVVLRGRIDRIDVGPGGEAVVYDYKGRDAPAAARWIKEGKLQVALYMRAAEQLLGLNVVGGLYQPLAGSELRARGVLDGESGIELECVSTDVREHEELRELLDEALASAREAAGQAAEGRLEPRPQTCAWRGGCRYPTICRCER